MSCRIALSGALASAMALASVANPASAGDAGAFIGGVAAGVLGTLAVQHAREPQRVVTQRTYIAPSVPSYHRESNRQVQSALNYFGFPAGVPDGVMGANSRAAIGQYQAFLSEPATGVLTDYQRVFLTSSYDRAISGGAATGQTIAAQGQGTRGLLIAYRQEQMGIPAAPVAPQQIAPQQIAPVPVVPHPVVTEAATAGVTEASATIPATAPPAVATASSAAPGAMPSFIAAPAARSMSDSCDRTAVATSRNGGPQIYKVGAKLDPVQAVNEQFCLARTYAIDDGQSLAATAQTFTAAEIQTQCEAFAPSMASYVGKLVDETPEQATDALRKFASGTGIPPAQLGANARICLGVGYRTDNPDVALASALVLVGLGEAAYDELVAYHLINGFGVAARGSLGVDWLNAAGDALSNGATPLVTADEDGRLALLQTTGTLLMFGQSEATVIDAKDTTPGTPGAGTTATTPAVMALPKPASN
ncbi:MAG: peptidoglycan-binding domain-containing protein [Amaricoccus sp.]|uniref:peptidoglycan-binding domain-containing protein n=1 Tax=Amaricoccus sp. TaxID=1872485 RepID=UPI0039E291D0